MHERPDGLIITISTGMLKEKGYRNWLTNFLFAMDRYADEDPWTYWMRLGTIPKQEVLYIYLCIGGKIRYRANFVMYREAGNMSFSDGKTMFAKAWVGMAGPLMKAPGLFPMKGFRGFRYTQKIF